MLENPSIPVKVRKYRISSVINSGILHEQNFFRAAQSKQNKTIVLLLLKKVLNHVNCFFNKISFFKHERLFKILTFAPNLQISISITSTKKNDRKSENFGRGSKFRTTKCRTTDISKLRNCEYYNNER